MVGASVVEIPSCSKVLESSGRKGSTSGAVTAVTGWKASREVEGRLVKTAFGVESRQLFRYPEGGRSCGRLLWRDLGEILRFLGASDRDVSVAKGFREARLEKKRIFRTRPITSTPH